MIVTHAGIRSSAALATRASSEGCSTSGTGARDARSANCLRNNQKYTAVEMAMERAARHPKCDSMKPVPQFHGRATISTGGAAKWVSVPPIETLTNSSPRVAYFRRLLGLRS